MFYNVPYGSGLQRFTRMWKINFALHLMNRFNGLDFVVCLLFAFNKTIMHKQGKLVHIEGVHSDKKGVGLAVLIYLNQT